MLHHFEDRIGGEISPISRLLIWYLLLYNPNHNQLRLGRPRLDQNDIPILDHIILTLGHHLARRLDRRLILEFLQHVVVVHDALDKRLFEIAVDDTRGLGRFGALADGPLPDLVGAGGEEAAEVHHLAHGDDDLGEGGFGAEGFAFGVGGSVGVEAGEALFEGDGHGDDGVTGGVLFDPLGDFGEVFVFLADVVFFTEVDEVDDGFGGEEEEGVDDLDLDCAF